MLKLSLKEVYVQKQLTKTKCRLENQQKEHHHGTTKTHGTELKRRDDLKDGKLEFNRSMRLLIWG